MNPLKLESNFSIYQKLQLSFGALFSFFVIFILSFSDLNFLGYAVLLIFIFLFIFLLILIFQKIGLLNIDNKLYFAYFIRDKVIYKYEVDLLNKTAFSISKTKKSQKLAFVSAAKPDMASQFSDFTFYLLNDRHTKKDYLVSIVKEENVEKIISFLNENFNLKHESYNPRFHS